MDNFKRYFFVIFNILYLILGIMVLVFALWLQFGSPIHEIALQMQASQFVIYMAIAVGGVLTVVGSIGIFGTCYANKCLLYMYVIIISCFIIAEVSVGVYVTVVKLLGDGMIVTITLWNKIDEPTRNTLQERFDCCGFQNITVETNGTIPCSCFKNQTSCDSTTTPADEDDYYQIGCYDRIMQWIENNLYTLIVIASLVLFFELCQVVVASLLIQAVGRMKTRPSRRSHHRSSSGYGHDRSPDYRGRPSRSYEDDYHHRNPRRHKSYSNTAFQR